MVHTQMDKFRLILRSCPERAQGFKGPKTVIHDATVHVQIRVAERPISKMPGNKNKLRTAFGKREQWSRKR